MWKPFSQEEEKTHSGNQVLQWKAFFRCDSILPDDSLSEWFIVSDTYLPIYLQCMWHQLPIKFATNSDLQASSYSSSIVAGFLILHPLLVGVSPNNAQTGTITSSFLQSWPWSSSWSSSWSSWSRSWSWYLWTGAEMSAGTFMLPNPASSLQVGLKNSTIMIATNTTIGCTSL